jgi:ceramide glucosyltransferase
MHLTVIQLFLGLASLPFVYYLLAIYSSRRFFSKRENELPGPAQPGFTPPLSILKPVRGLDPDAYENFASFCGQDYPEYEIVFCLSAEDDPAVPMIETLQRNFPKQPSRVLFGSRRSAVNDKVAKLVRLADEAAYEHLVINDSDVRVRPDYLRNIIAPLADPKIGAVTCLYVSTGDRTFIDSLQTVGMLSDFYAGLLVARELDGVKFALGPTIATTRAHLAAFGGYRAIENRPGDDLLVGQLISEQGYEVVLSHYVVETVSDYQSLKDLLHKRMRWLVVMRHMRPLGHLGLLFTQGLPWSLAAIAVHPTWLVAAFFLGSYFFLRTTMSWVIGVRGLKQRWLDTRIVVAWDAFAFVVWLASFCRNSIRWRGGNYRIRNGQLVPAGSNASD